MYEVQTTEQKRDEKFTFDVPEEGEMGNHGEG